MEVKVLAYSLPLFVKDEKEINEEVEELLRKKKIKSDDINLIENNLNLFSGHMAGVCYMNDMFETLYNESVSNTLARIKRTQDSGHHSVFDHPHFTLQFTDIPKMLVMMLNNEKDYATSEKSARYTVMDDIAPNEKKLYDKWLDILKDEMKKKYWKEKLKESENNEKKALSSIEKLAQEKARYMISVFTLTKLGYTVSYRQINYIYSWIDEYCKNETNNKLVEMVIPYLLEFKCALEKENERIKEETSGKICLLAPGLQKNSKNRKFSLILDSHDEIEEYFGDVYSMKYEVSFSSVAQLLRHRSLCYTISLLDEPKFFVPGIIKDNKKLSDEWLNDIDSVKDNFPQGMLVSVNESGILDNFILKAKERDCIFVQYETYRQFYAAKNRYYEELKKKNHPRTEEFEKYMGPCRATYPDFKCTTPCGHTSKHKLEREI